MATRDILSSFQAYTEKKKNEGKKMREGEGGVVLSQQNIQNVYQSIAESALCLTCLRILYLASYLPPPNAVHSTPTSLH